MTHEEMKDRLAKSVIYLDVVAAMVHSKDIDITGCMDGLSLIIDEIYSPICDVIEALNEK